MVPSTTPRENCSYANGSGMPTTAEPNSFAGFTSEPLTSIFKDLKSFTALITFFELKIRVGGGLVMPTSLTPLYSDPFPNSLIVLHAAIDTARDERAAKGSSEMQAVTVFLE